MPLVDEIAFLLLSERGILFIAISKPARQGDLLLTYFIWEWGMNR